MYSSRQLQRALSRRPVSDRAVRDRMRRQAMDSKEMKLKTYVGEGKVPEFVKV